MLKKISLVLAILLILSTVSLSVAGATAIVVNTGGAAVTVKLAVPPIVPLAALIVTGPPAATPVARPDEFTVAIVVLELVHVKVG